MNFFSSRKRGVEELLKRLGQNHSCYMKALALQSRLLENIEQTERYGDTDTQRADRTRIVCQLNSLALETIGVDFNRLCVSLQETLTFTRVPLVDNGLTRLEADLFVGREKEKQIFEEFVSREISANTICVYGFGGVGKSALLRQFVIRVKDKVQIVHGSMRGQNLPSFILTYASHLGLEPKYALSSDFVLLSNFLHFIDKPTVVLIDDYPETPVDDKLTNWLIDEVQRRNCQALFVLVSRRKPGFLLTSPVYYIRLAGLSLSETKDLIERSVNTRSSWIRETIKWTETVHLKTGGNPKIVELLCTNQQAWSFFRARPEGIELHSIAGITKLYRQIWQSIDETTKDASKLLATCVQVTPYIPGGLLRDLIPNWELEVDDLLGRCILTELDYDLFSLHDTFKDFIYQQCLGIVERQRYHQRLASYYLHSHQLENRSLYALIHSVECCDFKSIIQAYAEAVNIMISAGNVRTAEHVEERILKLVKRTDDETLDIKEFQCQVLQNLAYHHRLLSDYQNAISKYQEALYLAETLNYRKLMITCNSGMGDVYRRMGNFELALKHYWQAHDMCGPDDTYEQARAFTGIAATSKMLGNYSDALGFHSKAKSLYETIQHKKGVARSLRGQAATLVIIGRCEDALLVYVAAKELYETEVADERGKAYALWGIGEASRMIGNYSDALANFKKR